MYGVERGGATYALAMELVEGDDLSQRIARGALTLDEVFPIAGQIADALEAAHERAEQRVREILARLGLELHSDKTRRVVERLGRVLSHRECRHQVWSGR